MQYAFLIRSSAGDKKYVTRLRLVTYFLPPARERIKNTYCMDQRPFLYSYCALDLSNIVTRYTFVKWDDDAVYLFKPVSGWLQLLSLWLICSVTVLLKVLYLAEHMKLFCTLSFFLSYLGWHMLPSHASAESCLTGWPNAQPQEGTIVVLRDTIRLTWWYV